MTENDLKVIYQDDDILVFNKPSGMVVNRSNTYSGITVQDVLDRDFGVKVDDVSASGDVVENDVAVEVESDTENDEFESRSGIVHRLDKDTSGLLIIARNRDAFKNLQKQFKERVVSKEYKAIVFGTMLEDKLEIDAPIGRNPNNRLSLSIVAEGRPSHTYVEKIKELSNDFAYVLVRPTTGRTHQIRVHMTAINHSVAKDQIYNTKKQLDISSRYFDRLMLHAHKISFYHPISLAKISYEAPLPEEFLKSI